MAKEDKKTEHVPTDDEKLKQKSYYSDEALLKMVNLLYDPLTAAFIKQTGISEEAHLLSLTRINSSKEAYFWAVQIAKESVLRRMSTPIKIRDRWPVSKIIRVGFLLARRSLDMTGFKLGVGLAQEQALTKAEDVAGEEADW